MAVPPLHERVLHACEHRVALHHRDRNLEAVDDVQNRDRDDRRDVEPDRDVEVFLSALGKRPEEVDGEDDPDQRDRDVDRPFQLGVLLALRDAEGKRDAAPTMMSCQPQKWMDDRMSEAIRAFVRRWVE